MVTASLLDTVQLARHRIMARYGRYPATFRCHTSVIYELQRIAYEWAGLSFADLSPTLYGMALVEDDGLEPGAWRLLDEFDTLLYDCRMGALP